MIGFIMSVDAYVIASALIVDDNQFNREIFRLSLKAAGYETTEVGNGAEALALLDTRTFSLIVLDLQMPLVDGATVLRNLRSNPAHASTHIIVATANPHMAVQDIQLLADYVVYKPMDVHEFARLAGRLKGTVRIAVTDSESTRL
jgi:CheY-like chemotaxis protein